MRVIPQKSYGGTDQRATEDGHLRYLGHLGKLEIIGKLGVTTDIGEHGESPSGDHGAANRQPVQTVSEVDGVAGTHDHQRHKYKEWQKRERPKMCVLQTSD